MRLITVTITIFTVTSRLLTLAIAKPVPNWQRGGISIPLTRHSPVPNSNGSVDLDAIAMHGRSVREKILNGMDNYEMNTGTIHPFSVKRNRSELRTRGESVPLRTSHPDTTVWVAEISIGTPPQTFNVQIDSGAADMWVLETGCWGISGDRDLYDPHASESARNQDQGPFQLKYSDGTVVKGDLYTDNVTIAGFTADPQMFGSAIWFTSRREWNVDGLLGLAFPTVSEFRAHTLLSSLINQGRLINPTFSLKLSSTGTGAEMYIGGANGMLYNGDIAYTRLTQPGFWQVVMDNVYINGHIVLENIPVILDTGASHIFGNWNQVSELYKHLGGTLHEPAKFNNFGFYYLPCHSFPTVGLTFGGVTFDISPEALNLGPVGAGSPYCFSAIIAEPERWPARHWGIGLTFLQGVYTVFDYATLQVGFAKLA